MNAILKAILKPILLVLLPIIYEELKKLIENWQSEQRSTELALLSASSGFSAFLEAPETSDALIKAVDAAL